MGFAKKSIVDHKFLIFKKTIFYLMEKIKAKKSLGQNFLHSQEVLTTIIETGNINPEETVLEIGPGEGILTEKLLKKAQKIIAVELDSRLIPKLESKFAQEITTKKLKIIHGDILNLDFKSLELEAISYKLIANIPYYITGEILKKFLESKYQPEKMVLLVQKEVAERIVAKDNKESILSLSIKIYGEPKYETTVEKESFDPVPKVDSAILSISNISKNRLKEITEETFFKIVKAGFAQKRKKLANNLSKITDKEKVESIFAELNLNSNIRAENISLEVWIEIVKKLKG